MPGPRKQNVGDTARAVTRKALSGGKDAAAQGVNATLLSGAQKPRRRR